MPVHFFGRLDAFRFIGGFKILSATGYYGVLKSLVLSIRPSDFGKIVLVSKVSNA